MEVRFSSGHRVVLVEWLSSGCDAAWKLYTQPLMHDVLGSILTKDYFFLSTKFGVGVANIVGDIILFLIINPREIL